MEIVKDQLHIPFVHPDTISTKRPFVPPEISSFPKNEFSINSIKELSFKYSTPVPHEEEDWHCMVDPYPSHGNYLDYYFFPNLHFMVPSGGYGFAYCSQFPQEANLTAINYLYTTAKRRVLHRVFSVVALEALSFGLRTFLEDVAMMENVQLSANSGPLSGKFGRYDLQIKAWRNFFRLHHERDE
jgi:phenylpropionate dioxygenase-like ring-hydroxylating dioxygenase large terminal subunit